MIFKVWDKLNNRWVQLWKILIATNGEIMGVEDLEGEIYGLHQVTIFTEVK